MLRQIAGCEDGGCPGLWIDGNQLYAQGNAVTDPQTLARLRSLDPAQAPADWSAIVK